MSEMEGLQIKWRTTGQDKSAEIVKLKATLGGIQKSNSLALEWIKR